jgi:hypothetical protein
LNRNSEHGQVPGEEPGMPESKQRSARTREDEINELAAPIIELADPLVTSFVADLSGRRAERFLREHATQDPDVDAVVRRFIEYSVTIRRGRRPA